MGLASKLWWKIQLCLRDPVSFTLLPTLAKEELFWKFMALSEAWSGCSWYLPLSFPQNEQAFEEVFQNANFNTYEFRIRVKLETYNVSNPPPRQRQIMQHVAFVGWLVFVGGGFLLFVGRSFQRYLLTVNTVSLERWRRDPLSPTLLPLRFIKPGLFWMKTRWELGESCLYSQLTLVPRAIHGWDRRRLEPNAWSAQSSFPCLISPSQDESRIKATAMDVKPVNYRDYCKRLIASIRRNAQLWWGGWCWVKLGLPGKAQ